MDSNEYKLQVTSYKLDYQDLTDLARNKFFEADNPVSARGFLARAMGRQQQAAAITLQRHARGIAIRVQAGHQARCAGHPEVQGSEPWRARDYQHEREETTL
ncbi:hypothetical protein THAOC_29293 [Thalassiosira oceanica]|uniref:Uncharacterized protein n=1 Tax=Thalassiosira oceanica TaxID=159749 RepID=K0RCU2_THAOC|nr:hypothetical protein THAOC_29293 [Thalassiosira oceanica]|eukprot:EJK51528.1 hypothetical protein THAOC_29293 [Thalassiosira oceanica]